MVWIRLFFRRAGVLKLRLECTVRRACNRFALFCRLAFNRWRLARIRSSLRPGQKLVCIGLIEHFGDIIACEPVARRIREDYPDDHIVWIVKPAYKEILAWHPAINGCVSVSCLTEFIRLAERPVFDRVVDLHVNNRRCTTFGTVHRKQTGDPSITTENYYSFGSLLEAFSRGAGLPQLHDAPKIFLPSAIRTRRLPVPGRPYIVIHASSNENARDWTVEKWALLIAHLQRHFSYELVEVGLFTAFNEPPHGVHDLCGKLSLIELAEVIRRSSGFIGIDSGPAHLANASMRPSVVLLGRYRAFDWYNPYTGFLRINADEMLIHCEGPVSNISVDDVVARCLKVFADRPGPHNSDGNVDANS